jgi:hypothetical protein
VLPTLYAGTLNLSHCLTDEGWMCWGLEIWVANVVGYHDSSIDQGVIMELGFKWCAMAFIETWKWFWPMVIKSYVVAEENYVHLQWECDSCMFLFIWNSILKSDLYDLNILCDSGVCQLNLCYIVRFLTVVCIQMIFIGWWSNVICITGVTKWKICADYWLWLRIWIWIGTSAGENGRNMLQYLQIVFAWVLVGGGNI